MTVTAEQGPAAALAQRTLALSTAHPWMDAPTTLTLAAAPVSDAQMMGAADTMKSALLGGWDGYAHIFDDPVLTKTPSNTLIARAAFQTAAPTYPVNQDDIADIQSSLASQGFGQDLPQGVWDPAWNQALYQYTNQRLQEKYAGDEPSKGSAATHSVLHTILRDLSPSKAWDAIIGTVKAIPGDVRSLVADTVGAVASDAQRLTHGGLTSVQGGLGLLTDLATPLTGTVLQAGGANSGQQAGNRVGAAIESVGRAKGQLSEQDYVQRLGVGRALNDVSTILLAAPALGEGSAAAKALRVGRRVITDPADSIAAASRAGGVISRSLRPTLDVTAKPGMLAKTLVKGTAEDVTGGLLHAKWMRNLPVLSRTGPVVARALGDEGWLYRSRISPKVLHANLYSRPGVQAAGNVLGRIYWAGAGLAGAAQAENAISPTPESQRIDAENDIPGWADWTVLLLHPTPGTALSPGSAVSSGFARLRQLFATTPPTVTTAMDDALRLAHDRIGVGAKDWNDLVTQIDSGHDGARLWLSTVLSDIARSTLAEKMLPADERFAHLAASGYSQEKTAALQTLAHEAIHLNPRAATQEAYDLATRPDELTARFYREIATHWVQPGSTLGGRINDYMASGEALRQANRRGDLAHLITPASRQQVADTYADARAATEISGEPPIPKGLARNPEWRQANITQPLGSVGLARLDTLDRQQALRKAKEFEQRLTAAKAIEGDPDTQLAAVNAVSKDAARLLFEEFGQDARKLEGLGSADKMVDWLRQRAGQLAVAVYPARNAPQTLKDTIDGINSRGYKLVFGTDIGHAWSDSLPDLPELGAAASRGRKVARALALSGEKFADASISSIKRDTVRVRLQNAVDAGKITLPPLYTVDTLIHDLQDSNILANEQTLPFLQSLANFLGVRVGRTLDNAKLLAKLEGQSEKDVTDQLKAELISGLGLRDLRYSTFKKVLGRTDQTPWTTDLARSDGGDLVMPLMDPKSIVATHRAVQSGLSSAPTYMVGLAKLDDIARRLTVPFGKPLDNRLIHFPHAAAVIEGIPSRVMNAILRYRFTTSPMFSLRRVVKTNVKMSVDGVPPTWDPLQSMAEQGTFDQDKALLDRIYPESHRAAADGLDQAVRQVMQSDAFGLYNARFYEMYAAGHWARQGLSDSQIRAKIVKVFTYGSGERDARSALERSMNTVFFPFSFSRTLYRNLGGYLIDRPVQLLAIAAGVQQWRAIRDNTQFGKWVEGHLPILQDLTSLNAFAHGMSLGQLGGVYAPVVNLFLPQHWTTAKGAVEGAQKMVPLWADFNRQFLGYNPKTGVMDPHGGILTQQAWIAARGAANTAAHGLQVAGLIAKPAEWAQAHPAMTFNSQLDAAYALRTALYAHYATYLAANEKANSAIEEYTFPDDPQLPVTLRGKPITKTNIGWLVHAKFPAYDPTKGEQTAVTSAQVVDQWLGKVREQKPQEYAAFNGFVEQSRKAARYLNSGSYTDQQAAQAMSAFHTWADAAAQADPEFRTFYAKNFAWLWGPLSLQGEDVGL